MPWYVNLHTDAPLIETTYAGHLTLAAWQGAWQETLRLAERCHYNRLLRDYTALEGQLSLGDLYFFIDTFVSHRRHHALKEAVLLREQLYLNLAGFWETTASNRGLQVRCFDHRQPAIDWLLQD